MPISATGQNIARMEVDHRPGDPSGGIPIDPWVSLRFHDASFGGITVMLTVPQFLEFSRLVASSAERIQ